MEIDKIAENVGKLWIPYIHIYVFIKNSLFDNKHIFDKLKNYHYLFRKSALAKVLVCYNSSGRGDININGFHCTEYLQGNPRCDTY